MPIWVFSRIPEAFRALHSDYDSTNWQWLEVLVVATNGYLRFLKLLFLK